VNNINDIEKYSIHVLYVEDDLVSRKIVLNILNNFFDNITIAKDGSDGLKKLKENNIDLILTDIDMPIMNGFEMIASIRNRHNDVPIVILSSFTKTEYFTKGIELGVDGYLVKPFKTEQFIAILGNVIKSIKLKSKLNSTNKRIDLALVGSKTAILDLDIKTNSLYISPQWKEMLGYKNSELESTVAVWKKLLHKDDRREVFSSLNKHILWQLQYFESTHRFWHKAGHFVWVIGKSQILYDDNNQPIRIVGTYTDISKEKDSKEEIKEQHQYLQSIIDGVNDQIMVIKEDYSVDLMNSKLRKIVKSRNSIEPTKLKCYEIAYNRSEPCNSHDRPCPLRDVIKTKRHAIVVHDRFDSKGNKKYVEISASPLFDNNNDCIGIIESARDITEHLDTRNELEEQKNILHYQAHHDALTGLPNRILFNDRLEQGIQRAKKDNKGLALFFLDLDHFKSINDSLGHNVGDEVLQSVTHRLTKVLRDEDTLARLGGDEFTIIMGNINDTQEATLLAEKIIDVLVEPITVNVNRLYVSFSIGISLYPEDGDNTQNLLKYADAAMYKAKDGGRNDFQFYSSEMTDLAHKRVVMEANLQDGLKNEDFLVYYQPQFNAKSNKLIGLEALVRWKHPTMGLVKPSEFIELAESTGLVVGLDKFVMKTAMGQIYRWHSDGLNPGRVSLNISIRQLQRQDFVNLLETMMKETKCKTDWIELEITEGHIMSNPEETIEILNQISDMGIRLSIDDFGTGYSSLSHLKKLPISKLKIDRSFVEDLPHSQDSAVIAKSIIALAHSLNLTVIAEGVETQEQKDFLLKSGCENIQGYLYSKPIPQHELEVFLKEGFNIDNSEFKFKFW